MENNSADEGVSLSATPASDENTAEKKASVTVDIKKESIEEDDALGEEEEDNDNERKAMLEATIEKQPPITSTASSSNHDQFTEHRVNAVVSQPPREIPPFPPQPQQQITHPLQQVILLCLTSNSECMLKLFHISRFRHLRARRSRNLNLVNNSSTNTFTNRCKWVLPFLRRENHKFRLSDILLPTSFLLSLHSRCFSSISNFINSRVQGRKIQR